MCKSIFPWHIKNSEFYQLCPSGEKYKFDAYYAHGRMDIARAFLEGELKPSEKLLHVIYTCTLCGACDYVCGRVKEMNPSKVILTLRSELVRSGLAPPSAHRRLSENVKKTYNVFGEPHNRRFAWIPNEAKPSNTAEILFFTGCVSSYRTTEIAQDAVKIFQMLGIKYTVLGGEEWCCGGPILRTGQENLARKLANHIVKVLKEKKIKVIVTTCPGCYLTLKVDYPHLLDVTHNFEVLHITEFLEEMRLEGRVPFKPVERLRITYHDPCHLGRNSYPDIIGTCHYGVYEPPRNLLKAIPNLELIEMKRIKEDAWCCGAGGGVKAAFNDLAIWVAEERLLEAAEIGAEALVSACPFCKLNFTDAAKRSGIPLKIYDITEVIKKAISKV